MRKSSFLVLVAFFLAGASFVFAAPRSPSSPPTATAAFDMSCPWCTTPTKCGRVYESSPIYDCFEDQEGNCQEVQGNCVILTTALSPENRDAILGARGLDYQGERTVDIKGIQINGFLVGDGLVAKWSCNGSLIGLFGQRDGGEWELLDVDANQARYRLDLTSVANDTNN